MNLSEISKTGFDPRQWEEKGYQLPRFDPQGLYSRANVFSLDLYEIELGQQIEAMTA